MIHDDPLELLIALTLHVPVRCLVLDLTCRTDCGCRLPIGITAASLRRARDCGVRRGVLETVDDRTVCVLRIGLSNALLLRL